MDRREVFKIYLNRERKIICDYAITCLFRFDGKNVTKKCGIVEGTKTKVMDLCTSLGALHARKEDIKDSYPSNLNEYIDGVKGDKFA